MKRVLGPYLRSRVVGQILALLAALTGLMQLLELLEITTDVLGERVDVTSCVVGTVSARTPGDVATTVIEVVVVASAVADTRPASPAATGSSPVRSIDRSLGRRDSPANNGGASPL